MVIVVHLMTADNWTLLSLRGGCMAVAALRAPFYEPDVKDKFKCMGECSFSIVISTSLILGRCLLVSGAFKQLCDIILSTAICSCVFLDTSTVTFSPPGSGKTPFRRDPKATKETESCSFILM